MSYLDARETIPTVQTYLRVSTEAQVEKFSFLPRKSLPGRSQPSTDGKSSRSTGTKDFRVAGLKSGQNFSSCSRMLPNGFQRGVVTDFDRLARPDNLRDLGRIQEVFIEHDVKIVTLSDVIDLSDDDQWFVSSLLGIVGAKEKKKIVSRMKRGIQAKKEAGGFYGGIPPPLHLRATGGMDKENLPFARLQTSTRGKRGRSISATTGGWYARGVGGPDAGGDGALDADAGRRLREARLLSPPRLRTERESFPSFGSSISKAV